MNEPAFPQRTDLKLSYTGMALRDYFAAKAMQAMLGWDNDHTIWDSYAEDAYMMADAMLKARES
jgi:hypothetical protein